MAVSKVTKALENEAAKRETVDFEFEGVNYTVAAPKDWPLRVVRAQESGLMVQAIERLMGSKQMKAFDPNDDRTLGDLERLLTALFDAVEVDPKE